MRSDVEPMDVLISLSGLTLVAGEPSNREQVGRVLGLPVGEGAQEAAQRGGRVDPAEHNAAGFSSTTSPSTQRRMIYSFGNGHH